MLAVGVVGTYRRAHRIRSYQLSLSVSPPRRERGGNGWRFPVEYPLPPGALCVIYYVRRLSRYYDSGGALPSGDSLLVNHNHGRADATGITRRFPYRAYCTVLLRLLLLHGERRAGLRFETHHDKGTTTESWPLLEARGNRHTGLSPGAQRRQSMRVIVYTLLWWLVVAGGSFAVWRLGPGGSPAGFVVSLRRAIGDGLSGERGHELPDREAHPVRPTSQPAAPPLPRDSMVL